MRIFIHGTDKGNAVLIVLIFIMVFSVIFISLTHRITATNRFAREYKAHIILDIEKSNREIVNLYDLY